MNVSRAARQILAVSVCALLLQPGIAAAAAIELPSMPLRAGALAAPALISLSGAPLDLTGGLAPLAAPAQAGPAAVDAHPVIAVINKLQANGALPESLNTAAEAAQLEAGAQALPPGPMREKLLAMARAAAVAAQGSGSPDGLSRAYDKSAAAPAQAEAPLSSSWLPAWLIPSGLRRAPKPEPTVADAKSLEVPIDMLRWSPDLNQLPESTRSIILKDKPIVGQDNALKAIYFGAKMKGDGYNLYISGVDGSGRETAARAVLAKVAAEMPTSADRVAVTDLRDPSSLLVLDLPAGKGPALQAAAKKFLGAYGSALPQALSSPQIVAKKRAIKAEYEQGVKARKEAFAAEVAQVRFNDKFGIWLSGRQDDEGLHPMLKVIYNGADGKRTSVDTEEKLDQLRATDPSITLSWDELVAAATTASEPYVEKLHALAMQDMEEGLAGNEAISKVDGMTAAQLVKQLAPALVSVIGGHNADTPEHKAWEERAKKRMEEFQAEIGKMRVGEYGLFMTQQGFGLTKPENGEMVPLSGEEFQAKLAAGELSQDALQAKVKEIMAKLQEVKKLNDSEHEALHANDPAPTQDEKKALVYIQSLLQYAANEYEAFLPYQGNNPMEAVQRAQLMPSDIFRVDVIRSSKPGAGSSVIVEKNPTFERLFGSFEESVRNLMLPGKGMVGVRPIRPGIKAGSFFQADFLVLDVLQTMREGTFPAIMKAVANGEAEIADGAPMMRSRESVTIKTKPKIVFIGSPMIKRLLDEHEADRFSPAFGAAAEFEPKLSINKESIEGYLQFFKKVVTQAAGELKEVTRDGMAALLQFAAREVSSNSKLTSQFGRVFRLMKEADFYASEAGSKEVRAEHVQAALQAREEREEVYQRHMVEGYQKGIMRVDVDGSQAGQINGLVVAGGTFGLPQRVLASYSPSEEPFHIVWADQAAKWTGHSADKSKADVEAFFYNQFGQKAPIKGKLTISFTQLYGGLDGDSATSTMIYAGLSAISGVPIQQRFAVTGSANMKGEVQVIGGAIEKTEGFFSVASYIVNQAHAKGLNAVIIPWMNAGDLQLKPEVVQAVREGKFKIYRANEIGQGMDLLTDVPYQTIKDKVAARLVRTPRAE